jgi:hypothetical protein
MHKQYEMSEKKLLSSLLVRGGVALLILMALAVVDANGQTPANNSIAGTPMKVTHVMGLENVKRNLKGELSIDSDSLRFRRDQSASAAVTLSSIQNVSLGEQDKQVGGVPMMLGKAAVPFGGGRVVSLFSHKKYDGVTIEYSDSTGGFHSIIFRMAKGQGETLKNGLMEHGTHIAQSGDQVSEQSKLVGSVESAKWSIQVDRIDPGATTLDPCFSDAIYENLLRELPKRKQFNHVFRSGDRNANDVSGMLILKMVVEKYSPGSETRRAVTTVTGATKLKVHIQLVTRDGRVVMESAVAGNVRFIGDNLRATSKLASNTAKVLQRSALPASVSPAKQQETAKEAAAGI